MKAIRYISFVLFSCILIIAGCTKNNEIDFDAEFEAELFIDLPPQNRGVEFYEYTDIDPKSNLLVNTYLHRITNVDIETLSAEFVDISKDISLEYAYFTIYDYDHSASWEFEDVYITEGTILTLGNTEGQYQFVKNIINTKETYYVSIWGESAQGDVIFTIKILNKYKFTAD